MSGKFIEIPADAILGELRSISEAVKAKGGKAEEKVSRREIVFEITPPNRLAFARVYTSLASGSSVVRGCGDDAVRLVLGSMVPIAGVSTFKPLAKSRRIYRTAPKGDHQARIAAFLKRFKEALRETYADALRAHTCPVCKVAPMVRRTARDSAREFYGCVRFPECMNTRPVPQGAPSPGGTT